LLSVFFPRNGCLGAEFFFGPHLFKLQSYPRVVRFPLNAHHCFSHPHVFSLTCRPTGRWFLQSSPKHREGGLPVLFVPFPVIILHRVRRERTCQPVPPLVVQGGFFRFGVAFEPPFECGTYIHGPTPAFRTSSKVLSFRSFPELAQTWLLFHPAMLDPSSNLPNNNSFPHWMGFRFRGPQGPSFCSWPAPYPLIWVTLIGPRFFRIALRLFLSKTWDTDPVGPPHFFFFSAR